MIGYCTLRFRRLANKCKERIDVSLSVVARREEEESLSYMLVILNITGMVSSQRLNYCIVTDFLLLLLSYLDT